MSIQTQAEIVEGYGSQSRTDEEEEDLQPENPMVLGIRAGRINNWRICNVTFVGFWKALLKTAGRWRADVGQAFTPRKDLLAVAHLCMTGGTSGASLAYELPSDLRKS